MAASKEANEEEEKTTLGMLQTSGFGWNDTDKTINVESDEVWRNYVKKDSSVRTYRNKSFPYYDNWCLLFGKDRATGELAEGPEETLNAMNEEDIQTVDGSFVPPSPGESSAANAQPPMQMGCSSGSGRKRGRSERRRNEVATLSQQFGGFFEQTVGSMNAIAQRIGYEQDLSQARKGVDSKLLQLPLDRTSRLKAGSLICKDAHKVDHFSSLETLEERLEWVYLLLSGDI